jgi:hypothetical protein
LFNKAIVCARANTQLFWPFIFILSGCNQYSVFSVFTDEIFDGYNFSTKVPWTYLAIQKIRLLANHQTKRGLFAFATMANQ